jgi:hypothetical protein
MKKERYIKLATWIMLGIFAWFYCGNTLFLHTHVAEGHKIVHSHPYLPSDSHSHSSQALQSIAAFNATAASMDTPYQAEMPKPVSITTYIQVVHTKLHVIAHIHTAGGRAPPVA